jgi:tetratricopeptide (TPR) repeat protein
MTIRGSGDHAWKLLEAGQAKKAVAAYETLVQSHQSPELSWLVNHSLALAAVGNFDEAVSSLSRADKLALSLASGFRFQGKIAQLLWLAGEHHRALDLSTRDVAEIASGNREYADAAGGASNGLILYSIAVAATEMESIVQALSFLESLAERKSRLSSWPGPLASFLLGHLPFEALVLRTAGCETISAAIQKTHTNMLVRRELSQLLFYAGLNSRLSQRYELSDEYMNACRQIPNPLLELEWYMARSPVFDHTTKPRPVNN